MWTFAAVDLSVWQANYKSKIFIPADSLDRLLSRISARMRLNGTLREPQIYVEDTPFEDLIWLSNYAHHGGMTVKPQQKENPDD